MSIDRQRHNMYDIDQVYMKHVQMDYLNFHVQAM